MSSDVKYNVNAGFFDAINEDRTYSADDMNRPYRRLVSNGVFATPTGEASDDLQVFSGNNGMNIIVSAGNAIIGDRWFENPSDLIITIPQNSEVLSRVDSIIAQVDKTQAGRIGNIVYRQGVASSNPVHPEINTEENIFELRLADIIISPSCVKITQDLITDCRGSSECPWVTSLIYQVDTSTLYAQWQAAYQKYYEDQKLKFEKWFEEIKGKLSEDEAGRLQLLIDDIETHLTEVESLASGSPLVASSISEMTDTTRVYVNTTDGHWYTYNGNTWVDGGVYQAKEIADGNITPDKININSYSKLKNIYDTKYFILNSHITGYKKTNEIKFIDLASGDPESRKVIKFSLDGVTEIQFNYPYNQSQAWGRAYQVTKADGELINNSDILFANYNTIYNNQSEFCSFNQETKIINLDIASMRAKYPDIKEIYIAIYEQQSWNITAKASINYLYRLEDIKWLDITHIATKDYTNQEIEQISMSAKYDSLTKSNLYQIVAFGDSLTENGNGSTSYTDYLKSMIGNDNVSVLNFGIGGQSSGTIAWRQGGLMMQNTESFQIPTDNTIPVTFGIAVSSGNILNFTGVNNNLDCTILNIPCTMSINTTDSTATLTRKENGSLVNVPENTQIKSTQDGHNKDLLIIWIGKNDIPNAGNYQITGVMENIKNIIGYLSPEIKRYVVISVITGTTQTKGTEQYNTIQNLNNNIEQTYKNNYLDMQNYLVNDCIYDMQLTPTEEDLEDIQNGTIPRQLLSDGTHPTPACREYIAKYIYNFLLDKGWIIK